ncbi:MAG: glycosyltransferase family 2 protein [Promethearchaeota archaeon]
MKFSIVIPAFNEEQSLRFCLMRIKRALVGDDFEIIVVNDGSTDGMVDSISSLVDGELVTLVNRPVGDNGFGKAIRAGLNAASGDYVVIVMADSSEDPADIKKMIRVASWKQYDMIVGTRFDKKSKVIGYPALKLVANRLFNYLAAVVLRIPFRDLSNAFKMYKKSIIDQMEITSEGFDITIELPIKAALLARDKIGVISNKWYGRNRGSPKWKLFKDGILYLKKLVELCRTRKVRAVGTNRRSC